MQIALIPPIAELEKYHHASDMQLALNHLMDDQTYAAFMARCGEAGEWVTLDNSAHEYTAGQAIEELLVNAIRIQAREIVIPDVLFHSMYTVESGRSALKFLYESDLFKACSPTPRIMVVPQGRDELDWAWCLKQLAETAHAYGYQDLLTIGLSKDYAKYPGFPDGLNHLIYTYLEPMYRMYGVQTHLLGWTCDWEMIDLARSYSCLRSTDSAKPFIYALNGTTLHHGKVPKAINRPEGYFEMELGRDTIDTVQSNITAFKLASRGVRQRDEESLVHGA